MARTVRRVRKAAPKRKGGSRRVARRRKRSGFVTWFKLGLAFLVVWGLAGAVYYGWALTYDLSQINEMPQRSAIFDKDGKFFSRLAGENRVVASFDNISNHFVNALITREDTRFYSHRGVDPIGVIRAAARNLMMGGIRQGGSTITQQLARNSFPLGGRTLHRKLLEAALAFRIETELSKEAILEAYVNRIYFGSGFYGVDTASRAYFGKSAAKLSLSEAALLAGLIRSPTRLSPFNDLKSSVEQRDVVLHRMAEIDLISKAERDAAMGEGVRLAARPKSTPQFNWAVEAVMRELELVLPPGVLDDGGLEIFTAIDPELQRLAERSLGVRLVQIEARAGYRHPKGNADDALQGAVVCIDNATGGVRAMVGSRSYGASKFNRATLAERQAGSTVKPFVFAAAFERGLKPGDRISDARLSSTEIPKALGAYDPANYDGKYGGQVRLDHALAHSRNTPAVRVALKTGLGAVSETLTRAGVSRDVPRFPSVALGAFETTLFDLTTAFTIFPNGGVKRQPFLIERIVDRSGKVIYKATRGTFRVISDDAARMVGDAMVEAVRSGTGSAARSLGLRKRGAGKTGTTNDFQDAWFVGYTKSLTCGVWVGFDQPRTIVKGGSGAALALPVWVDVIQGANGYPD